MPSTHTMVSAIVTAAVSPLGLFVIGIAWLTILVLRPVPVASQDLPLHNHRPPAMTLYDGRNVTFLVTKMGDAERIDDYMQRKGLDRQTAVDQLLVFALDTLDGRRKGGKKVGNRPQQEKHLARARKQRGK